MVVILWTASFCVADSWADFANNLGSDLAPLIALFGEKVTTQYLSESFSILDNLVFALAPIGIITAIVAAIRVGGNAQLRSFIGRATESRGTVEADLMSSTSSDVCELWNGQGVVRVLGSPRILQLIYIESEIDGPEAGIYELRDAVKQNLYREEQHQGRFVFGPRNRNSEHNRETGADLDRQNPPNLSLNINIDIESRRGTAKILVFVGVLLQGGVLLYAGLAQYKPQNLDHAPMRYGFPLFVTGTLSLAAGMFLCAQLIESSTNEYAYKPVSSGLVTTFWVQKGGQTVGDQLFESFLRKGRSSTILVSHRSERNLNLLAIVAVGTALVGFATQFIALRAMHATITVAQLGVVLFMTALLSFAHMQRIGANDLPFPHQGNEEELNWLAISLLGCDRWDVSRAFSPPSPPPISSLRLSRCFPIPLDPTSSPVSDIPMEPLRPRIVDVAMDLLMARARLAQLTPQWPSKNRNRAQNLRKAIENTMNYVFPNMDLVGDWEEKSVFEWSVPVTTTSTSTSQITLILRRTKDGNNHWGPWTVAVNQLEAMICLWSTSMRRHSPEGQLQRVRVFGPTTEHSEPDHKLWISRGTPYQMSPGSGIVSDTCFGWYESVGSADHQSGGEVLWDVTKILTGDIETHCTEDLYGWLIRGLLQIVKDIGGTTTTRSKNGPSGVGLIEQDAWDWLALENSSLNQLALYFVESDLGTFEEAYFCLFHTLRDANMVPYASVLNKTIAAHSLMLVDFGQWREALEVGRWCSRNTLNADHVLWASITRNGVLRDLAAKLSNYRVISKELRGAIASEWERIVAPSADHVHGLLTMCRTYENYESRQFPTDMFHRACQMAQTLNISTPYVSRIVLELAQFSFEHEFLNEAEILSSFLWRTARCTIATGAMDLGLSEETTDRAAGLMMDIYRVRGQSWVETEIFPASLCGVAQRGISDEFSIYSLNDRSIPTALLVIMKYRTPLQ